MATVLVIEDEAGIRENIQDLLEVEGFDVLTAADGDMGIKLAINRMPDIVISDIMMPGVDGYGVLESLKNHEATCTIPLVFLTAKQEMKDLRQGMVLGATDYLTKPFRNQELLEVVNTRLKMKNQIDDTYSQSLNAIRNNLTQSLPHELRTPLAPIVNLAQIMQSHPDKLSADDIKEFGGLIQRGATRLSQLIEKYILIAELELITQNPDKLEMVQSRVTSHSLEVIEATVIEYFNENEKRASDFDMQLAEAEVNVSSDYLKKIVFELLDNACKFSADGTPIRLRTRIVDGVFELSIRDKGRGMKPEQIKKIGTYVQFEREQYEQQGMGFGLSIVNRISDIYDGKLTIKSKPENGTIVQVLLPIQAK